METWTIVMLLGCLVIVLTLPPVLQYLDKRGHHPRCDSDLCDSDCPVRKWAELRDYPYPGKSKR